MLASLSVISFSMVTALPLTVLGAHVDSTPARGSVRTRSVASIAPTTSTSAASTSEAEHGSLAGRVTGASSAPMSSLLATAARQLGTRYRFGGALPGAFDCSGFVRYVFGAHGVGLPRTAREQATIGRAVSGGLDSLRVGDLLFFRTRRGRASHVAIYVGDGRIIHASAGSRRVRYDDLASSRGRWFVTHLSGVRRIIEHEREGTPDREGVDANGVSLGERRSG